MDREKLIEAGVDYDEGAERFCGKPELYERYLVKFVSGGFMSAIERQIKGGDIKGAFRATHDLKGVAGNLSLNRFYAAVCELTELLRDGSPDADYSAALARAKGSFDKVKAAVLGIGQ